MATIKIKKETDINTETDEEIAAGLVAVAAASAAMNMIACGANRVIIYDPKGCWGAWVILDSKCHPLDRNNRPILSITDELLRIALGMCGDSFDFIRLSKDDKVTPIVNYRGGREYGNSIYFAKTEHLRWH